MAYTAEIQIAVKGAKDLRTFQAELDKSSKAVDRLNRDIQTLSEGGIPRSINNLNRLVAEAAESFNKVALNTSEAATTARDYYQANKTLNNSLRERLKLLNDIQNAERGTVLANIKASQAARSASGFGVFSAGIEGGIATQKAIRRNAKRLSRQPKAAIEATPLMLPAYQERGLQILNNTLKLNESQVRIEQQLNGERARGVRYLEKQSAEEARQIELGRIGKRTNMLPGTRATQYQFPVEGPMNLLSKGRRPSTSFGAQVSRGASPLGGIAGRLPGAISGSIIGGAFPLLFGQGAGAATGGAIGGLVGGLAGPGGSFAGSLLGTLLGDIASRGQAVKQLGQDLGFSAQQAQTLATAFKTANTDVERFTAVIQNIRGLGYTIDEQANSIKLITTLTQQYGGSFEKVGNAITSALESGKVSQGILNQLTSQGINIQDALAKKLNVSRDSLLDMTKKGKVSVQTLLDTLVELGNTGTQQPIKIKTKFEQSTAEIQTRVSNLAQKMEEAFASATPNITSKFETIKEAAATAFSNVIVALTPMLELVAKAIGDLTNLGIELISQFIQLPSYIDSASVALQTQIPIIGELANQMERFGKWFARISPATASIFGIGPSAKGVANPLNLDLKPGDYPVGIPIPGTPPEPINRLRALSQAAPSGAGAGNAESAKQREAKRLAALLLNQRAITAELKNQYNYNAKIFAAESAKDPMLARRLQGEQQLVEWGIETAKLLEKEKTTAGQLAIAKTQQAKQALIRQQTEQDLARMELERLAPGYERQTQLQEENYLLQASLAGNSKQVELELRKAAILKGITDPAQAKILVTLVEQNEALKTAADRLQMEKDLFGGIASTVAGVFDGALTAAVRGTEELGAALQNLAGDLLFTIGRMLIMYGIAQALGALGGGDKVGIISHLATAFGFKGAKDGAYWSGGFQAFAEGGMVTRPTMGLIGEGGESEYVIPASKMRGAMNRYAAGARGSAVIPAGSDGGDGMTATMAAPGAIDVRYTVERINSVDYVTADQFQRGMQQAAAQGAAQGEQRTLRRLQSSNSTRKRLGI